MNHFVSGKIISANSGRQYLVKDEIGTGGYGTVFEAADIHTGEIVAIKTIRFKEMLSDALKKQYIKSFSTEIEHCSSLAHPNIVKLLSHGFLENQQQFAVFEYIHGFNLKEYVVASKKLPPLTTRNIMLQLLEALLELQSKGIVHGDIKPQNVMLCGNVSQLNAKLFDFGSSIQVNKEEERDYLSLPTTVHYAAPEQLRNENPTHKSDIYAWGLMLLECLSGHPAISGKSLNAVIQNQLSNNPVNVPNSLTDKALLQLLKLTLNKEPTQRTDDIPMLKDILQNIDFNNMIIEDPNTTSIMPEPLTEETAFNKIEVIKAIIGI